MNARQDVVGIRTRTRRTPVSNRAVGAAPGGPLARLACRSGADVFTFTRDPQSYGTQGADVQ
jgi:hypothetical protein